MYAPTFGEQSIITSNAPGITSTSTTSTGGSFIMLHSNAYHSEAYITAADLVAQVYPGVGIALSTGSAWDTSITNNSANWDTAYGWGNHTSAGYVTGTPWTALGYITSAALSPYAPLLNPVFSETITILRNSGATVRVKWASGYGASLVAWDGSNPKWGIDKYDAEIATSVMWGYYSDANAHFTADVIATGDVIAYA